MKVIDKTESGFVIHLTDSEMEMLTGNYINTTYSSRGSVPRKDFLGKVIKLNRIETAVRNINSILVLQRRLLSDLDEAKKAVQSVGFPLKEVPSKDKLEEE